MRNLQKVKVKLKRLITGPVIVNTDEYSIYERIVSEIEDVLDHWVVNHSEKEWARGFFTTAFLPQCLYLL